MKILIIALSGIGDALMFTPALVKLKEKIPSAEIEALVMFKGVKNIYENLPQISKVHYHDFINNSKLSVLNAVLSLRGKFDISINVYPSNRKEYNIISRIIGAKKRAAVDYLRMNSQNLGFLNNLRITENDLLHNVEENMLMIEKIIGSKIDHIPSLQFNIADKELNLANNFLREKNISDNDLVIGFHPGCSALKNHDKRRWEPEKFAKLGNLLIEKHNAKIFVFGGPEENQLKESIVNSINSSESFDIKTNSLSETAAIMKRCNVFVSNDSSLMHVAAALGLYVVAIIGPTNTNYIKPWDTEHSIASLNLECAPCFVYSPKPLTCTRDDVKFKCIKELEVDLVLSKVEEKIKQISKS